MASLSAFSSPNLAKEVEALSAEEVDQLPFGVIGLSPEEVIRVYNKTEAEFSGYRNRPSHGRRFFVDVAPCMNNSYFKGRVDKARREGKLDIAFTFVGDFEDQERELSVRVQSAHDGGIWIFHHRSTT